MLLQNPDLVNLNTLLKRRSLLGQVGLRVTAGVPPVTTGHPIGLLLILTKVS